ncbi:MAG: FKBP-type peptidyl-prolyl cis-trans isomerase [Gammaproteobacteria bacterium]|nr:FKBP-type peptidyl-prolyl cis-trans isomerase [Gammaproteobacteria bacterium]MCF6229811.1 FKBP-type peptidyl-prolyl cis-trans isomerase [Gammaproteobacteria bacterium]
MRIAIASAVAVLISSTAVAETPQPLQSEEDQLSYTLGYQLGQRLAAEGVEINADLYSAALREGLQGAESRLSPQENRQVMERFQQRGEERRKASSENNLAQGMAYLEENSKKPDVTVLDSGLQYKIITQGEGGKPSATDTVKVHYRGVLINGLEFDSSYSRNEPATFPVNRVIPGWTAILQMMPVGSHYQVTIPSELAYGERGAPPMIGPNAVLVFDIELLNIEK